jgi:sugar phosphate isomerase/epimerase
MTVSSFADRKAGAILKLAKKFGVSFVEFNRTVWDDLPEVAAQIDGVASGYHLPLMSEDGFDFSCVDEAEQINSTIDLLNKNYRRLNLRYCLSHPPEPEQAKESVRTSVDFLLDNLSRLEAPILLENVEGWSEGDFDKFYSMARTRLGDKLWGMCFDPAHAFLRADDLFLRFHEIAGEVRCIHLSDCTESHDAHLPFSCGGVLPIDRILKFVRAHRWRGIINLEIIPRSLSEIEPVVKSYLKVLRRFSKGKYFATLGRLAFGSKTLAQTESNVVDVIPI